MRRLHEALLLALILLAVQTAIVAHHHADGTAPIGAVAQSCEFCTGHSAAAPAPERRLAVRHEPQPLRLPSLTGEAVPGAPIFAAHRSRAPPSFRSS